MQSIVGIRSVTCRVIGSRTQTLSPVYARKIHSSPKEPLMVEPKQMGSLLSRSVIVMAIILSETEGKANKKQGIKKREHENNSEKILDNCELGLDVFVVHGDIIDRVGDRCKLLFFFFF